MRDLSNLTWQQVPSAPLVVVPVGSIEQHGPHLPLDTDLAVAQAVAMEVVASTPGAWLAPALPYGASGEHQDFAGTCSIGTEALRHVVLELVRSMSTWARRVVLINGHGGNVTALTQAVDQLVAEGHDVAWVGCQVPGGDLHAGMTETSLMQHIRPISLRRDRIEPGNLSPLQDILPTMAQRGVAAVSANGVLGDPRGYSEAEGRRCLTVMVASVQATLDRESLR